MKYSLIPFNKALSPFDNGQEVVVLDPFSFLNHKELLPVLDSGKYGIPSEGIIIHIEKDNGKIITGVIFEVSDVWTHNYVNVKISESYYEKVLISQDYVGIFDTDVIEDTSKEFIGYISNDLKIEESNYTSTEFSIITNVNDVDFIESEELLDFEDEEDVFNTVDDDDDWENKVEDTTDYGKRDYYEGEDE